MPSGARSALYRGTRATATALVQQRHLPRGIDRLQATADGELRVDVLQVKLDGVFGDENTARYFLVRNAVGEIDEDLLFAIGQRFQRLEAGAGGCDLVQVDGLATGRQQASDEGLQVQQCGIAIRDFAGEAGMFLMQQRQKKIGGASCGDRVCRSA